MPNASLYRIIPALFLMIPLFLPAQRYIVERLPDAVNSAYNEINPVISNDGQTLYFTRSGYPESERYLKMQGEDISLKASPEDYTRLLQSLYSSIAGYNVGNPYESSFNQDVWIASLKDGQVTNIEHPGPPLNNAFPNTISSLTPDPDVFVVINQYPDTGGIERGFSLIERTATGWEPPQPITIDDYYTQQAGLTMTMSSDGEVLILSLDRKDSQGDNDLYICFKTGENHWSEPKHLGNNINSPAREITPHLSPDKRILYFASNREGGYGGMDLFYSERAGNDWFKWSVARRFVEPINTASDESQPYFNPVSGNLFFSSRRSGSSDIYQVKIAPAMPEALDLYYQPVPVKKKHRSNELVINGMVVNSKTKTPEEATLTWSAQGVSGKPEILVAAAGNFAFAFKKGFDYILTVKKKGYISREIVVQPEALLAANTDSVLLVLLDPIEENTVIQLDNIYFQRSLADILEKSYPALDRLVAIMKEYKNIQISIEGHTDNVGPADELQKLSEARAAAVKKYLTDHNISPARIATKGYGDSRPVSQVNTEDGRQLNRRVEVRITRVIE